MHKDKSALVLLSGGLDSATCLYLAKKENKKVFAISFDYSQRHKVELNKAKALTLITKVKHQIIKLNPVIFQNSSLVDKSKKVPGNFSSREKIPNTYVPGRNILFLSFAASYAESFGIDKIYIGVNALDYSGYPDCRPEFIESYQKMIRLGMKSGDENRAIKIITPLANMTKKEIVILAHSLKVPFGLTHSCYDPKKNKPCGICDSCLLRKKGFSEAGIKDI